MTTVDLSLIKAAETDRKGLTSLLSAVNLPTNDLPASLESFLLVKGGSKIIGCIGLEVYKKTALLRSFATDSTYRNQKIGQKLFEGIIDLAKSLGVEIIFLITTTAEGYFSKRGFQITARENVPGEVKATSQFSDVCPSTALVMSLKI